MKSNFGYRFPLLTDILRFPLLTDVLRFPFFLTGGWATIWASKYLGRSFCERELRRFYASPSFSDEKQRESFFLKRSKRETEWRRKRKEGKRKNYFFNSTGISLMRNIFWKRYSDCYSALQTWRVTVANLKKKIEIERLLDFVLGVNSGFFLQILDMPSAVGDALTWLSFSYQLILSFETLTIHNNYNKKRKAIYNAITHQR